MTEGVDRREGLLAPDHLRQGDGAVEGRSGRSASGEADPGVERLRAFLETKTVWHPVGV
jgi:hypothetical protein